MTSAIVEGFRVVGSVEERRSGSYWEPPEGGACEGFEIVGVADTIEAQTYLEDLGFGDLRRWALIAARWIERYGDLPECVVGWLEEKLELECCAALEKADRECEHGDW